MEGSARLFASATVHKTGPIISELLEPSETEDVTQQVL